MAETLTVCNIGPASLEVAATIGIREDSQLPIDQNGLARCIRGYLVYEPDVSDVFFPFPQRIAKGGLHSLVAAPMLVESKVFGILIAARKTANDFTSDDCEFLRQLSEHTALATHQTKLYTDLQQAYNDLRLSQRTIMQQERLRALGEMASGISHDINNAISPAALYAESLLERESGLTDEAREYLETIQRAIADVAQTMSRMREFYRQREPQMALEPVDLNKMAKQAIDLSRARWRDVALESGIAIEMRTELASDLPPILGAEAEIRDALINLIFNAVDAIVDKNGLHGGRGASRGGQITVCTEASHNYRQSSTNVQIEVTDDGIGMDEDTKRRCLEPFYTTKGERGTGLGLPMVYGMVQRHNSDIEIDSRPGAGTTMRILFPAAPVAGPTSNNQSAPARPSYKLQLLVVDDDPMLIKSLRDILEKDGHAITTADGGAAGIEAFELSLTTGQSFDAVITDLGMPHVDGRQVAATIKNLSPDTPVILLTGWGQRMMAEQEMPPHVDRLLAKPPRILDLRAALAAVTNDRTSSRPS